MAKYTQDGDFYEKEVLPYLSNQENKEIIKEKFVESNKIASEETEEKIGKKFRDKFSNHVLCLFISLNVFVGSIILIAFGLDEYFIYNEVYKEVDSRLVTPQVLMILIGATATQIAVAFGLLSKYIFKVFDKRNSDHNKISHSTDSENKS